jgi:hypothetical protein
MNIVANNQIKKVVPTNYALQQKVGINKISSLVPLSAAICKDCSVICWADFNLKNVWYMSPNSPTI